MPIATLVTVPGVELIRTGTWEISTGTWNVTTELLESAVDAYSAGVVRRPPLKLGHDDPRFDGEPAVGYLQNLRVTADGQRLIGDYAGVPQWLADVLASAYPSRSVEGFHDVEVDGRTYPFVLTACAILGVTNPGITTIADIPALFAGVAAKAVAIHVPAINTPTTAMAVALAAARRHRRARGK